MILLFCRLIKGRKSYRPLRELSLRNLTVLRHRTNKPDPEMSAGQVSTISSANATIGSETRRSNNPIQNNIIFL